ncbi:MAG TPA: hypothetical protein VFG23_12980, partial [Polyangia bacterium]|nr:hypothetical protein [Polyangia bacterium]
MQRTALRPPLNAKIFDGLAKPMNEYVQYHKPEYAEFPTERAGVFSIYSRKTPRGIRGSRIWLVVRKRDTREYYLVYWFIADTIVLGKAGKPNGIEGKSGAWLRPRVRIDQMEWFLDFRKYMGNFGLGLQKIVDPTLTAALRAAVDVERLARGHGLRFSEEAEELHGLEGQLRARMVAHRQRESSLREAKIAAELKRGTGRLTCEVPACRFDFEGTYGPLGSGYAHVHHLRPLSTYRRFRTPGVKPVEMARGGGVMTSNGGNGGANRRGTRCFSTRG